jgi:uncharacterized protein YraI
MSKQSIFAMTAAGLLTAAPALAQVSATAATDLNLRAGPASNQQVLTVIPANGEVVVEGCLETGNWCQVNFQGTQGWAHGGYLNGTVQRQQVVVIGNRSPSQPGTLSFAEGRTRSGADAAVAGASGAALAGLLVGGPIAIALGAMFGASVGLAE